MRLIDADKLQKEFQQKLKYCMDWKKKSTENEGRADAEMAMLEECIITIDCQPLIDAVPVVRCKDCKHREQKKTFDISGPEPKCLFYLMYRNKEGFCQFGEKNEAGYE